MIKKFRNIFGVALTVLSSIAFGACSDNDLNDVPEILGEDPHTKVTPTEVSCDFNATERTFTITADADWSAYTTDSWCSVYPTGGLKGETVEVTLTIDASTSFNERTSALIIKSGKYKTEVPVIQGARPTIAPSLTEISLGAQETTLSITVKSNIGWTATSSDEWLQVTPAASSGDVETTLTIKLAENDTEADRVAYITIAGDGAFSNITVKQFSDVIIIPEGYALVWNDEFSIPDGSMPDLGNWYYEEWDAGMVNNELQRYVAGEYAGVKTAEISGGILHITASKVGDQVISARLNTKQLWTYGYFEARLKLPKGKGTWPAFWMMPENGNDWPHCGEIDIMEEVGTNPNYTSSSIHCTTYNHTIGTQKTAERLTAGAEDDFHIYALEWTPDYIRTYIDGVELFSYAKEEKADEDSWPFDKPFHPILNLAWGGDWGGMNGVDESALPATFEIDYVRVFQKP